MQILKINFSLSQRHIFIIKTSFFSIYLNLKLFSISCFSSLENRAGCIADNGKSIGEVRENEEL